MTIHIQSISLSDIILYSYNTLLPIPLLLGYKTLPKIPKHVNMLFKNMILGLFILSVQLQSTLGRCITGYPCGNMWCGDLERCCNQDKGDSYSYCSTSGCLRYDGENQDLFAKSDWAAFQ